MLVVERAVEYKYGQVIRVKPIFDVHEGDALCDTRKLKTWLAEDDEALFVFGGDTFDTTYPGHKFYQKMLDTSDREAVVDYQVDHMYDMLEPYNKRIVQIGLGNHEKRICSITNPCERLARRLGVPYSGYTWVVLLHLREMRNGKISRGRTVKIMGHHGWGSSTRTEGGSLTKYCRHAKPWNADICLYGHDHHLVSRKLPRMDWVGTKCVHRPKQVVLCGTWTRTLTNTADCGYAEEKGYDPVEIGGPVIHIKPRNNSVEYWADT